MLSCRKGCNHVSWISHSVESQFYRLGRGCIGTSHKVGSQWSHALFHMKYRDCLIFLVVRMCRAMIHM